MGTQKGDITIVFTSAVLVLVVPVKHAAAGQPSELHFILWTPDNPGDDEYYLLQLDDSDSLAAAPLNPSCPTVIIIHGYNSNGHSGWSVEAKTELLMLGEYNVLSVDWEELAEGPWYPEVVENVGVVGAYTARLLEWLQRDGELDVSLVQAVGHSLGAHVAGAIGQNVVQFRLPFITGLDPAGPEFYDKPPEYRLDPTDAEFVQVIHTEACSIVETCLGLKDPVGDVDFYPNGGEHQPGCRSPTGERWQEGEDDSTRGCSHGRAHDYWIESINGNIPFTSRPCHSWDSFVAGECPTCGLGCLNMGFHVECNLTGKYYLWTNSAPPYAQG